MNGRGCLFYSNGEKAYEGEWCDDKFNNYGHLFNLNPEKLDGYFDYRDFRNIGNYWTKYEGDFKMDKKNSFGILHLSNGEKYAGNFFQD